MLETSARLLRLLSLLQMQAEWNTDDLAERLGVVGRTVRRDVARLRTLGYPIRGTPGVAGGYGLGAGANMPPLLLDDEETVAVAVGLSNAAGGTVVGIEEASVRALAKLEQVLPSRLRHQVSALTAATLTINRDGPKVDPGVLTAIARACRDCEVLRFDYRVQAGTESVRRAEPHRLVCWNRRWYLVAWDTDRQDWRTFRVDRLRPRSPNGPRFAPREPPRGDVATYIAERLGTGMWPVQARVRVHAPAEAVAGRTGGLVEPVDDHQCLLSLGGVNLNTLAAVIGMLDVDFDVIDPPALSDAVRRLAERYRRATPDHETP
jgi:predicted DNA-binding transcriptional regulator YafY